MKVNTCVCSVSVWHKLLCLCIFVPQLFSIQDFLECVGRLQDHADVLDDVRKDLLLQLPTSNNMEELQIQIDECQVRIKITMLQLYICGVIFKSLDPD